MSYARFSGESDVYVFAHVDGYVQCCGCWLEGYEGTWNYTDLDALLAHLQEHIDAGHKVPDYLLDRDTYDPSDFEA